LQDELRRADHLLKCIADMVSAQQLFARDASREALEPTEPASVVRAALAMNTAAFRRLGIVVETDLQVIGRVPLARTQLLQVVNNLLKNAIDAVAQQPADHRRIHVALARHEGEGFQIRVADSGCGIAADQLASIFRHGYTTKLTGHGFGLSSCSRLVQQFDGSLTAASEGLGRGAAFTITIPGRRTSEVVEAIAVAN
jgi:C4-dicarboxylate-specific signal transduction histidine kinase